jgi:hypothetical protein
MPTLPTTSGDEHTRATLRTHGWLAWPVWLGIWIATVPGWVAAMLVVRMHFYGIIKLPRSFNVFGYDGFVNALYDRVGASVPAYGGWHGVDLPATAMVALLGTAVWIGRRGVVARIVTGWASITALLLAALAMALQVTNHWDGWICVTGRLLHRGHLISMPLWNHIVPVVAATAIAGGAIAVGLAPARRSAWHDRTFVRWVMALAAALWLSSWLFHSYTRNLHSTRVLAEAALAWSFTASVFLAYRAPTSPTRLTQVLLAWGSTGHQAVYAWLYLLGPGAVLLLGRVILLLDKLVWLRFLLYLTGVIIALQGIHLELLRHSRERLNYRFACRRCDYDLRGSVAADRHTCPECGQLIDDTQHQWVRDRLGEQVQRNS